MNQLTFTDELRTHNKLVSCPDATSHFKIFYNARNEVGVLETGPHLDVNGTHFLDDTWTTSLKHVSNLLGEPTYTGSVDDKVQNSWHCRFFLLTCYTQAKREREIDRLKDQIGLNYNRPKNPIIPQKCFPINKHNIVPYEKTGNPKIGTQEFCVYDWKVYDTIPESSWTKWHLGSSGKTHKSNCDTWLDFLIPHGVTKAFEYGFYMRMIRYKRNWPDDPEYIGKVCSKEEYYADEDE